jgi:hypothetical protein
MGQNQLDPRVLAKTSFCCWRIEMKHPLPFFCTFYNILMIIKKLNNCKLIISGNFNQLDVIDYFKNVIIKINLF